MQNCTANVCAAKVAVVWRQNSRCQNLVFQYRIVVGRVAVGDPEIADRQKNAVNGINSEAEEMV